MTITETATTTVNDVLAAVDDLAPTLAARAGEIEAARRLPRDVLEQLIAAGCFRFVLPQSHGGIGADLAGAMRVFESLARADASTGWTVMIGAGSWIDLAGLPRATFDALFTGAPDIITAGVFSPSGLITPEGDSYRVNGRWAFASGCEHATWIFGNCVEGVVDGVPQLRIAVFDPDDVVIEDTWSVSGLRGTGSHHFRVDDLVVPADRTTSLFNDPPCVETTMAHVPPPAAFSLTLASVATGVAPGALDDITQLADVKVPLLAAAALAASPSFQVDLAVADTELRAARGLLYETAASVWQTAVDGRPYTLEQRARIRAAAVWVTERAVAIVDMAYRAGGGSSIYDASPLQRRLRDVHAVAQHFLVRRDTLETAGAILAGQDLEPAVF